jgi:hypothetical protein
VHGLRSVLDARREDQDVAGSERELLVEGVEGHVAIQHLDRDGIVRPVRREAASGGERHHRQPERAFLHQRARAASMPRDQVLVDPHCVRPEVLHDDAAGDGAVHR